MLIVRESAIHGWGGFASCEIPAQTHIVEYVGERIDKRESRRRCALNNAFIFFLDSHTDLDGNVEWNRARWINHSCEPNAEAELLEGRIWIVARRTIQPGEEITFNYGYDLENYREYPCQCRASRCVGFIVAEEFHGRLRHELAGANCGSAKLLNASERPAGVLT